MQKKILCGHNLHIRFILFDLCFKCLQDIAGMGIFP